MEKPSFILILIFVSFFISCRHEPQVPDYPVISFSNDVNPIISSSCTMSGCHGNNNTQEFSLVGYENLMKHENIVAGKPHSSKIYESITATGGEDLMPRYPYSRLTNQQIEIIYLWILQGAKNN